jgi:hypothetical protein
MKIAQHHGCNFSKTFKQDTIDLMCRPTPNPSIMYQDFLARRPMETEVYLGTPIKTAKDAGISVPRLETMYAIVHNLNIVNQSRPASSPMGAPRMSNPPPARGMMNGGPPGGRMPSGQMRRGPPPGGFPPRQSSGGPPNGRLMPPPSRRGSGSFEAGDVEEFGHIALFSPENGPDGLAKGSANGSSEDIALRERELLLRQRELALREQELNMRRARNRPAAADDDEEYFDPVTASGMPVDSDNFDMMSVTSRKTRHAPKTNGQRMPPPAHSQSRQFFGRSSKNRNSARVIDTMPGLRDSILDDALMGYSSNRYGNVDRKTMQTESRAGSMTASVMNGQMGPMGPMGPNGLPRRTSHSPGNPFDPHRPPPRMSPPSGSYGPGMGNGPYPSAGMNGNGPYQGRPNRQSPPGGVQQPQPRYPPGQGNRVAPQQVEQHAGVSSIPHNNPLPPHPPSSAMLYPHHHNKQQLSVKVRSLTGSASASAGSGDSGASLMLDSENSAHSSQSDLARRPPVSVR